MTPKALSRLLEAVPEARRVDNPQRPGFAHDPSISSIVHDSRLVKPGSLFFAIPGVHNDGHDYLKHAFQAGAVAIIVEKQVPDLNELIQANESLFVFMVENCRSALSAISACYYDYPDRELCVIGVTGTDGKSSTVSYLHQLLNATGINSGYISTVSMQTSEQVQSNNLRQSTPEAPDIHRLLREMVDSGKRAAVVESTSHGLSHRTARLKDVHYDGAVFTNLTHEHLEFHGSFSNYRSDKANLFRQLRTRANPGRPEDQHEKGRPTSPGRGGADFGGSDFSGRVPRSTEDDGFGTVNPAPVAVINSRDAAWAYLSETAVDAGALCCLYSTCGADAAPDPPFRGEELVPRYRISASECKSGPASNSFLVSLSSGKGQNSDNVEDVKVDVPIPGQFTVDNVLASMALIHLLFRIPLKELSIAASRLKGVKGRMLPLDQGQDFAAIIDYAHSPGSFQKVFPLFRKSCSGRLIAVFGSAGERDVEKRPIQGEIAASYSDVLVITDEDPRLEDSMSIINEIARGAMKSREDIEIHRISNRREAIRKAFHLARPGDMVVMLGKGHEGSIITADGKTPWDEEQVAREILSELGYPEVPEPEDR